MPMPMPMSSSPPPTQSPMPSMLLNRGSSKRANRQAQVVTANQASVQAYNPSDEPVDALVEQQAAKGPDVDVVVSPISALRRENHLVLHRIVRTDDGEHRQGVVLRIDALVAKLEEATLSGSELRPWVRLAWDGAPAVATPYTYDHRFAEPFTSLRVMASLDRVPALIGREASTVRALAFALGVAVLGGGLGLWRAVWTQLEYARRRSDFVAAVSHELKTPLTTIRMYAEMLRDGMVPTADRQRTYHHTITMESDRLGRLIANVLELARLERGGPRPVEVVGSLASVVREAVDIARPHAEQAGFRIRIDADPDLPPVTIDRDAVVQIVVNLVDNAVKFAKDGDKTIELSVSRAGQKVLLRVRDHGPGVPRSQLRRVFEPFWRGERELTRRTKGTGIGLALVRGLAEQMGGTVSARNHPEGGFLVSVLLG
jgi:signal transduction histidine kinase